MVIEFIGSPGSGKTSIADELVETLLDAGVDAGTMTSLARRRAAETTIGKMIETVAAGRIRSVSL